MMLIDSLAASNGYVGNKTKQAISTSEELQSSTTNIIDKTELEYNTVRKKKNVDTNTGTSCDGNKQKLKESFIIAVVVVVVGGGGGVLDPSIQYRRRQSKKR